MYFVKESRMVRSYVKTELLYEANVRGEIKGRRRGKTKDYSY